MQERYPVLRELPPAIAERVADEGSSVTFEEGKVLFDLQSACDGYLLLLDGVLRVSSLAENGREILLYRLFPGDSCIVTTCCLMGENDYPVRAISDEPVTGVFIAKPLFREMLRESPAFSEFIFRTFAERLTTILQLVSEVAFRHLDSRLAKLLIERGADIEATHQEIASELGSVREIVSRLLKSFEDQGWVRLGRRHIEVLDVEALRARI